MAFLREIMSEELKPCPFCNQSLSAVGYHVRKGKVVEIFEHPSFTGCAIDSLIFTEEQWNTRAYEAELAALREENERLRQDANPWRYPSRGELPERDCAYEVTLGNDTVERLRWTGSDWIDRNGWVTGYVRAFRELPEPAPVLEEDK